MHRRTGSRRWYHLEVAVAYLVTVTVLLLGLRLRFGTGLPLLVPLLAATGLAVGLALVGAVDRDGPGAAPPVDRDGRGAAPPVDRDGRGAAPPVGPDGGVPPHESLALTARVHEVIAGLDGVNFRHVELGWPLPYLVVGPSGVRVVDVHAGQVVAADDHGVRTSLFDSQPRSIELARQLRRVVAAAGIDPGFDVRAVAVVSDGATILDRTTVATSAGADVPPVTVVEVDGLARALTEGPIVSLAVVERAFTVATAASLLDDTRR